MAGFVAAGVIGGIGVVGYAIKLIMDRRERRQREELQRACRQLRRKIKEERRDPSGEIINFRFLMFGITGHGKSTLCCGLKSALDGEDFLTDFFQAGSLGQSFTRGFCPCQLADMLWVIDMGGIFESNLLTEENIRNVVEEKVPFYAELGRNLEVMDPDLRVPEARENDLSCVVIVMKPDTQITEQLRKKFRVIEECAAGGRISRRLVVTHIEDIDDQFKDPRNLVNIEKSTKIRECREQLSQETGIPRTSITFVRNYWNQRECDVYTNSVLLELMQQLVQSGVDARGRSAGRNQLRNMR